MADRRLEALISLVVNMTGADAARVNALASAFNNLNKAVGRKTAGSGFTQEAQAIKLATAAIKQKTAAENLAAATSRKVTAETNATTAALRRQSSQLQATQAKWYAMRATALDLSYIMGRAATSSGIALAAVGVGVVGIARNMTSASARMEKYREQMRALTGSVEAGNEALRRIRDFAIESPLTFEETINSVTLLKSQFVSLGDVFKNDMQLLKTMTNMAVFSGRPLEQVARALLKIRSGQWISRYTQPIGLGKDFMESIGVQWDAKKNRPAGLSGASGPGIFEKIMQNPPDFIKNFKPEELLQTKLTNIEDIMFVFWAKLGDNFGEATKGILGQLAAFIRDMVNLLETPEIKGAFTQLAEQVVKPLGEKIIGFLKNIAAQIKNDPGTITRWFTTIANGIKTLAAAFAAFTVGATAATLLQTIATIALAVSAAGGAPGLAAFAAAATILGSVAVAFGLIKGKLDELVPGLGGLKKSVEDVTVVSGDGGLTGVFENLGVVAGGVFRGMSAEMQAVSGNAVTFGSILGGAFDQALKPLNLLLNYLATIGAFITDFQNNIGTQWTGGQALGPNGELLDVGAGVPLPKFGGLSNKYDYDPKTGRWTVTRPQVPAAPVDYTNLTHPAGFRGGKVIKSRPGEERHDFFNDTTTTGDEEDQGPQLAWPVGSPGGRMGGFGPGHHGIDVFGKTGDPVKAARSGKVVKLGKNALGDFRLWIEDSLGGKTYYTHLQSVFADGITVGATVGAGQVIGYLAASQHRADGTLVKDPHAHISYLKPGTKGFDIMKSADPMTELFGGKRTAEGGWVLGTPPMEKEGGYVGDASLEAKAKLLKSFDKLARDIGMGIKGEGRGLTTDFAKSLVELAAAVDKAKAAFIAAGDSVLGLHQAIADITGIRFGLDAARARAMGKDKQGDIIEGQGILASLSAQKAQIDRFKNIYAAQLAANDPEMQARLRGMQTELAGTATGGYSFVQGLRGQKGAEDLVAAMLKSLEALYPMVQGQLGDAMQSATRGLTTAGIELQIAAGMWQSLARTLGLARDAALGNQGFNATGLTSAGAAYVGQLGAEFGGLSGAPQGSNAGADISGAAGRLRGLKAKGAPGRFDAAGALGWSMQGPCPGGT